MLNSETKRHIDAARDVLVGVAPNPTTQIDQITYALIYKFMDDMDQAAIRAGGEPSFFMGELEPYAWTKLIDSRIGNQEKMNLYGEALTKFSEAKQLPELFRTIFKAAFLPYRSPETLGLFLKEISYFDYTHPEELGNAYEYLLSIMSSQGDAGQFRTPRHIIDFIVDVINPTKDDKVLDPACGTAGFLVSTYNHILEQHDGKLDSKKEEKPLTPDERKKLMQNLQGYDIDPTMVRIAQVNMYLHQFKNPQIFQYDSLTSEDRWADRFDVILANPPFMTPKGGIKPHKKFALSSNRSEVLFVDYIINHLKPSGRAGIVVPDGIIFQTGKAYKELRKSMLENGLWAVISLPSGVFQPYSGVKTSILFFDKSFANENEQIIFSTVSNDGTDLGARRRVVELNDLPALTETLISFKKSESLDSALHAIIKKETILKNENIDLSLSKYLEAPDKSTGNKAILGNFIRERKLRVANNDAIPVWSVSNKQGFIASRDYFDKDVASEDISNYKQILPLDFAYNPSRINVGSIALNKTSATGAVSPMYVVFEISEKETLDASYLFYILKSERFNVEVRSRTKGAVRDQLKYSDLIEIPIPVIPIYRQSSFVSELNNYHAIINGARQIVDSWKPLLPVDAKWPVVKLQDVAKWSSGGTPKSGTAAYYGGSILWANIGDLNESEVVETEKTITEVGLKESSAKVMPKGTVMLAMYGASIGKTGIMGVPMATNQAIACAQVDKNLIEELYLLYFLQSQKQSFIDAGAGGAQPNISQAIVKEWDIPLPPLSVQRELLAEIANEKSEVDIAKNLIQRYEARAQDAIAKLWEI